MAFIVVLWRQRPLRGVEAVDGEAVLDGDGDLIEEVVWEDGVRLGWGVERLHVVVCEVDPEGGDVGVELIGLACADDG